MGRKTLYFKANLPLLQTGLRRFMHKQMVNRHVAVCAKPLIHAGFLANEQETAARPAPGFLRQDLAAIKVNSGDHEVYLGKS